MKPLVTDMLEYRAQYPYEGRMETLCIITYFVTYIEVSQLYLGFIYAVCDHPYNK